MVRVTRVDSDSLHGHVITLSRTEIAELFASLSSSLVGNDCGRKEFYDQKGEYLTFLIDFEDERKEMEAVAEAFISLLELVPRPKLERLRDYLILPHLRHPISRAVDEYVKDRLNKPFRKLKVDSEDDE